MAVLLCVRIEPAGPEPELPPNERVDLSNQSAWPRWTPPVDVDIPDNQSGDPSVAIDGSGIAHFLWVRFNGTPASEIVYASARWATRQVNGLGSPVRISRKESPTGEPVVVSPLEPIGPGTKRGLVPVTARNPWIESGPGETLWAVWEETYEVWDDDRREMITSVYSRRIDGYQPVGEALPVEQGTYDYEPGSVPNTGTETITNCYAPNIDVTSANERAVSYIRRRTVNSVVNDNETLLEEGTKVRYLSGNGPPQTVRAYGAVDPVEPLPTPIGGRAEPWTHVALDPSDVPYVGWDSTETTRLVNLGVPGTTTWLVSTPLGAQGGQEITLASGRTGVVHAAWTGPQGDARYARWDQMNWAPLQIGEDVLAPAGGRAWIMLDHLSRPVILCARYFLRREPDLTAGIGIWTGRPSSMFPRDAAMDGSGNVWGCVDAVYSHMQDPDLGGQDPCPTPRNTRRFVA